MQVVMCEAYGGPESLVVKSVDSPSPGPGEVKVRLRARGVSFTDVLRIAGQYHVKTPPPFIPGGEAAGEIVQLGADVVGLKVGDRVLCGGGFAEETVQPAGSVINLPETVGFEAAAAFRSPIPAIQQLHKRKGRVALCQPGIQLDGPVRRLARQLVAEIDRLHARAGGHAVRHGQPCPGQRRIRVDCQRTLVTLDCPEGIIDAFAIECRPTLEKEPVGLRVHLADGSRGGV